ncbi:MAG: c-type cytochrome [Solirubrobacterales bacterium]
MTRLRPTSKSLVLLVSFGILTGLVAGCGAETSAPISGGFQDRGRQLFNAKCGTCHVMAQAASQGIQGPNLDTAFAAARAAGLTEDTVKGVVEYQIKHPRPSLDGYPGVSMPADIVTGNDLQDVARYVARYAGVPGAGPPVAPGEGPGAQVYANQGCGSCHILAAAESAGVLGPNLNKVIPGMTRAMIEQAIVEPDASKSPGYENAVMPNRWSNLPSQELEQLIDFLLASTSGGKNGG